MKLRFEMTVSEFADWIAYAQTDKVQTAASVREAIRFWADQDGVAMTDEEVEEVARDYEARHGVHMPGLAA